MRFLTSLVALAVCTAAASGQYPPPVVAAADPPPVVSRAEFDELRSLVADLRNDIHDLKFGTARSAPQPAAKATAVCGCKLAGSTCPTTGFCGGAGCPCTQAKLKTVPTVAPGVATSDPFVLSGCAGGRCTTLTTPVTGVGEPLPYGLTGSAAGGTLTPARAGTYGTTSGCANGACGVESSRFAPFNGRFRRN